MSKMNTSIYLQMFSKQSYYALSNTDSKKKQLICVVCGSIARGYNFGAITCMGCKMFFRRNVLIGINKLKCRQRGNCQMSPRTRRYCSYCRLLTCFQMGMKKDFIRKKIECSKSSTHTEQPSIRPLDLLQWSDRSQLSNTDWLLLRQISSIFDTFTDHVISKAHEIQHQLSSIGIQLQPLKMRAKASYIYDLGNFFINTVLQFIKSIPQFILLPSVNKQALLMRNTNPVIRFDAHYRLNLKPIRSLTETPYWISSMECLFLPSTRHLHDKINYLVGHVSFIDPCLIKLILVILTFSTNNIDHDEITIIQKLDEYYHAFVLHQIQNIYVELMWKYMIHRFGEERTIHLFSDIIKTILQIQTVIFAINNGKTSSERKFEQNIAKIIDQTLQFNVDDEL